MRQSTTSWGCSFIWGTKDIKDPGRKSWEKNFFKCILNTENSKYKDSNIGMTWHAQKKTKGGGNPQE